MPALFACSWGRSFLSPVPMGRGNPVSLRRALRLFRAARRRWPDGRLGRDCHGSLCWFVPAGVCPPGSDMAGVMAYFREDVPPPPPPPSRRDFRLERLWNKPGEPADAAAHMDLMMHEVVAAALADGIDPVELLAAVRSDDGSEQVWRFVRLN